MFLVCIFFKTVDVGLFVKIRGFSSGAGSFVGYKLIKQTLPMFLIKHLQIPKRFLQCMHGQRKMKKKISINLVTLRFVLMVLGTSTDL